MGRPVMINVKKAIKKNVPTIIALLALIVSICSVEQTRKTFIAENRPYVWAANYAAPGSNNGTITNLPYMVGFIVLNAPAKIISVEIEILLDSEIVFSHRGDNLVRFPNERSEWTYTIGKEKLDEILNQYEERSSTLNRIVRIEYSSLNGGEKYRFKLIQSYDTKANNWHDVEEDAN